MKSSKSQSIASNSKDRRDKQADVNPSVRSVKQSNETCQTFLSGFEDGKNKLSDISVSLTTTRYLPEPQPFNIEQTDTDETSQCKLNIRSKTDGLQYCGSIIICFITLATMCGI